MEISRLNDALLKLDRLDQLADAIDEDNTPAVLRMEVWADVCQTVACAGGNYVLMFPGCGLELSAAQNPNYRVMHHPESGSYGFVALSEHFYFMDFMDVHAMFDPGDYDAGYTPADVARRIRRTAAHYREELGGASDSA